MLLSDSDRQVVRDALEDVANPVRILFFTQSIGCEGCEVTKQILDEVVPLNDRITVEEVNFVLDKDKVAQYGISRVPALVFEGTAAGRVRFYGAPAGYEFMSLVEAIAIAGSGKSGLSDASRNLLGRVNEPIHIQVFTTPG